MIPTTTKLTNTMRVVTGRRSERSVMCIMPFLNCFRSVCFFSSCCVLLAIQDGVHHRDNDKREQSRYQQPSDYRNTHRRPQFCTITKANRQRQQSKCCSKCGH